MELPKRNRQGGGMFDGIKNKLGFSNGQDDDGAYYDDYDAYDDDYADDYGDEYDDYESDGAAGSEYSPYAEVTTRSAGTNRSRRSSYTDRASADLGDRRMSTAHPPLVSKEDVRATTSFADAGTTPTASRRRTTTNGLGRNVVGRASDFALSGAEIDDPVPSYDDAPAANSDPGATVAMGSKRAGGYDSLFSSSTNRSAGDLSKKPAGSVGIGTHDSKSTGAYDPYAAYEGAGSSTHKPSRAVVVITPIAYSEVESVARSLKAGDAVVLSLRNTPNQLAKRILDFSFGVASALDASVDCVADKVFAVTRTMPLTDAECMKLRGQGVM